MLLSIFLLWRAEPGFAFHGVSLMDPEYEALLADAVKLYSQSSEKIIKSTVMKTLIDLSSFAISLKEDEEWFIESRTHYAHAASVMLD
jgi:hypothetical protein